MLRILILFLISFSIFGETSPEGPTVHDHDGEFGNKFKKDVEPIDISKESVDEAHRQLSKSILFVSNRIDSFFGSTRADDEANGSRLRVFWNHTKTESVEYDNKADMKIHLRFPELQKKLKFSFKKEATQPQATKETDEKPKKKELDTQTKKKANTITTILNTTRKWSLHFNTGLKVNIPPNPFANLRLRRTFLIGKWEFNPSQEFFWFLEDGFGETTALDFDRSITNSLLFRFENTITWKDETDTFQAIHGPSLFHQLSSRRALSYHLKAFGKNRPFHHIYNYRASLTYRQLLHNKWLFMEITPGTDFPKSNGFEKVHSVTLRFEAVFGSL